MKSAATLAIVGGLAIIGVALIARCYLYRARPYISACRFGFAHAARARSAPTCSKLPHMTLYYKMASKRGEESGATAFCSESN